MRQMDPYQMRLHVPIVQRFYLVFFLFVSSSPHFHLNQFIHQWPSYRSLHCHNQFVLNFVPPEECHSGQICIRISSWHETERIDCAIYCHINLNYEYYVRNRIGWPLVNMGLSQHAFTCGLQCHVAIVLEVQIGHTNVCSVCVYVLPMMWWRAHMS